MNIKNNHPILYSFRRCPYAMRARLALQYAGITVRLREIALKHKPQALLAISPKATVPVLHLADGEVLAESMDIMVWALAQHDPAGWLALDDEGYALVVSNDGAFKQALDRYKYADRYPEYPATHYRAQGEAFLDALAQRLSQHRYLCGGQITLADMAIFPFIRQFSAVDTNWFAKSAPPLVREWLAELLAAELFARVMRKFPVWREGDEEPLF